MGLPLRSDPALFAKVRWHWSVQTRTGLRVRSAPGEARGNGQDIRQAGSLLGRILPVRNRPSARGAHRTTMYAALTWLLAQAAARRGDDVVGDARRRAALRRAPLDPSHCGAAALPRARRAARRCGAAHGSRSRRRPQTEVDAWTGRRRPRPTSRRPKPRRLKHERTSTRARASAPRRPTSPRAAETRGRGPAGPRKKRRDPLDAVARPWPAPRLPRKRWRRRRRTPQEARRRAALKAMRERRGGSRSSTSLLHPGCGGPR